MELLACVPRGQGFEPGSCHFDFRDWVSPVSKSKSRYDWKILQLKLRKTIKNNKPINIFYYAVFPFSISKMAVNIKQEALSSFPYSSVNVMDDEKSMQQSLLKKGIKAEVDTKFTKPLRVDVAAANNYQNVSCIHCSRTFVIQNKQQQHWKRA